uniref:Eukaryotic translation elongation factor 1 beta 2 n=1 Tax=Podarcis muralis TaxID=64176 RepID=A0A670IPC4_PODMU
MGCSGSPLLFWGGCGENATFCKGSINATFWKGEAKCRQDGGFPSEEKKEKGVGSVLRFCFPPPTPIIFMNEFVVLCVLNLKKNQGQVPRHLLLHPSPSHLGSFGRPRRFCKGMSHPKQILQFLKQLVHPLLLSCSMPSAGTTTLSLSTNKRQEPALVAKSSLLLDVKPWDDETDMGKLEECVRSIQADGLVWGSSKLVPVGYGIKKLQIQCVVEDDKVGTDMLEERITAFEDYVQSMDVAAFNKI